MLIIFLTHYIQNPTYIRNAFHLQRRKKEIQQISGFPIFFYDQGPLFFFSLFYFFPIKVLQWKILKSLQCQHSFQHFGCIDLLCHSKMKTYMYTKVKRTGFSRKRKVGKVLSFMQITFFMQKIFHCLKRVRLEGNKY